MNLLERLKNSKKTNLSSFNKSFTTAIRNDITILHWYKREDGGKNFGDDLNPWLFREITGKNPVNITEIINFRNKTVYSCIGSILSGIGSENSEVWGSGFIDESSTLGIKPRKVHAVRGPLTRKKLLELNVDCPEIYGDPALLLPKFYNPTISSKYRLGIVAHYVDKKSDNYKELVREISQDILIIDIEDSVENVIDNILKCEKIASSSLHGIIVADAYQIPSIHIKFTNNVMGGNFKFKDYMYGVKREYRKPLLIDSDSTINSIINNFYDYSIEFNQDELMKACPFA